MKRARAAAIGCIVLIARVHAADDLAWQAPLEPRARAADASGAEPVRCRSIQVDASAAVGPSTTLALVRRAPSLERIVSGERDACESADPYRDVPRPIAIVAGRASLADVVLPPDTDCFTVAVETDCAIESTPLDAVVPPREPNRVVAVLDAAHAADAPALAGAFGLRMLSSVRLRATEELLVTFTLPADQTVDAAVALLAADAHVSAAQADFRYATSSLHSDPLAALTFGPEQTGAVRLHPISTGKGVVVAIVDTGIDAQNAELDGRIVARSDFTGDGFTADVHGTAIAGIVAAHADNGIGSYGTAPDVDIVALKACAPVRTGRLESRCWTSSLVPALDEAIARKARIVNLSLGGPPDPLVARYVALAQARGAVVVAAAGNGGPLAKPAFPAALPGVIAVTAVDAATHAYPAANEGDYVTLAAPGVDVVSPVPDGTFPVLSGTSMAAAHASAVVALLLALAPSATPDEIRAVLVDDARDLGPPGPDPQFGAGLLDACAAAAKLAPTAQCPPIP